MALSGLLPASVPDAYSTKTIEAAQKKAAADRLASNIRLCHGPQGAIEVPIAAPMRRRAARVPGGRGAAAKPTPSELAATERQPDGTGSKTGGRPLTPPRKPDPEQERAILEQQARLAEQQVRLAHDIEQRRQEQAEREEDQARKDAQERKLQELRAAMPGLDEETITKLALGPAGSGSSSPSTAAVAGGSSQEAEAQQVEESGPYSRTAIRNAQHRARIEREQKEKNAETVAAAKAAAKAQERAEALRHRRQLMEVRRQKMRQQQEEREAERKRLYPDRVAAETTRTEPEPELEKEPQPEPEPEPEPESETVLDARTEGETEADAASGVSPKDSGQVKTSFLTVATVNAADVAKVKEAAVKALAAPDDDGDENEMQQHEDTAEEVEEVEQVEEAEEVDEQKEIVEVASDDRSTEPEGVVEGVDDDSEINNGTADGAGASCSVTCSLGHALERKPDAESFCDVCAKSGVMTRGTAFHCASGCDYDLCEECASFSEGLSALSPRSRTLKERDRKAWKAKCEQKGISALVDLLPSTISVGDSDESEIEDEVGTDEDSSSEEDEEDEDAESESVLPPVTRNRSRLEQPVGHWRRAPREQATVVDLSGRQSVSAGANHVRMRQAKATGASNRARRAQSAIEMRRGRLAQRTEFAKTAARAAERQTTLDAYAESQPLSSSSASGSGSTLRQGRTAAGSAAGSATKQRSSGYGTRSRPAVDRSQSMPSDLEMQLQRGEEKATAVFAAGCMREYATEVDERQSQELEAAKQARKAARAEEDAREEARMMELAAEAERVRNEERRAAKAAQAEKDQVDKERRARRYPRNNGRMKATALPSSPTESSPPARTGSNETLRSSGFTGSGSAAAAAAAAAAQPQRYGSAGSSRSRSGSGSGSDRALAPNKALQNHATQDALSTLASRLADRRPSCSSQRSAGSGGSSSYPAYDHAYSSPAQSNGGRSIDEEIVMGASPSPLGKTVVREGPAEQALARKLAKGGAQIRSQMEVELSMCRVRNWQG